MAHSFSTLRRRWQQIFFVFLAGAVVIPLVGLPQTTFAVQGQEKADVSPWSLVLGPWSLVHARQRASRRTKDGVARG